MKKPIILGLLVACIALTPLVLSQVETAPSLIWSTTFVGTKPSAVTVAGSGGFSSPLAGFCLANRDNILTIDWASGAPWLSYTDGNGVEGGGNTNSGILRKLNPSSGSTSISTAQTASFNIAGCGAHADQRGRIYAMFGPCGTSSQYADNQVYLASNGSLLKSFEDAEVCAEAITTMGGPYADILTDVTSNSTRASYASGSSVFNVRSTAVPTTYDQVCNFGTASEAGGVSWRRDGVDTDLFWSIDASGFIRVTNYETCITTVTTAAARGGQPSIQCVTRDATLDCFDFVGGVSSDVRVRHHDPTDTDVAVTISSTQTLAPPDPYNLGGTQRASNINSVWVDRNQDYVLCGQVLDDTGADAYGYLAKYSGDFTTLLWNITVQETVAQSRDCDLGTTGEIYWTLQTVTAPNQVQVRKYCCNSAAANGTERTITQLTFPPGVVPVPDVGGAVGFRDFCLAVGFTDAPGKFLCGLVIVLAGSVLVAFVLANRTEKGSARLGNVSLFGAGGTFFGLAIFVTVVDLWPAYTTILMIVLTAAVITFVIRKQFLDTGD